MKLTENLKLNMPDFNDTANIEDLNKNAVIIDQEIYAAKQKIKTLEESGATNEELEALNKKINELEGKLVATNSEIERLKSSKVDKVSGKGLSTNDFTNADKTEVAKIKNKADKAYVDTEMGKKVDKINGKGLSTNDFTNANKKSLENDIPNKIDILNSEIDTVKQSGVKSNRILVDALNSKEVTASTNDAIIVNVQKVNDIHVGDYSIGDSLGADDVEGVYEDIKGEIEGTEVVCQLPTHNTYEVTIDSNGDILFGLGVQADGKNYLYKVTPEGSLIWAKSLDSWVTSIVTLEDKIIYSTAYPEYGIHCRNADGELVWSKVGQFSNTILLSISSTDASPKLIAAGERDFAELNPATGSVKNSIKNAFTNSVNDILIDNDNESYIAITSFSGEVIKRRISNNSTIWEYSGEKSNSYYNLTQTDKGFIYFSDYSEKNILKLSSSGQLEHSLTFLPEYSKSDIIRSNDDNIIIASRVITKLDVNTNTPIWQLSSPRFAAAKMAINSNDDVYISSSKSRIDKISAQQLKGYKIVK